MQTFSDENKITLHDIIQPLNIIGLSCGAIRARFSDNSSDDAKYIVEKMVRIEEQVMRATKLITESNHYNEDKRAASSD